MIYYVTKLDNIIMTMCLPYQELCQQQPHYPILDSNTSFPRTKCEKYATPITPTDNDILMGRGGKNNAHIGNEKLRQLARQRASSYLSANKQEKAMIVSNLVQEIHSMPSAGRFLRRHPVSMEWQFVGEQDAREKCFQCLRDAVSVLKKMQQTSGQRQTEPPADTTETKAHRTKRSHETIVCAPETISLLRQISDHSLSNATATTTLVAKKRRRNSLVSNSACSEITGTFFDVSTEPKKANIFDLPGFDVWESSSGHDAYLHNLLL